jgi:hypothetical protein
MNKIYNYEKFDNEKLRFEKLLNFCNSIKNESVIICTRTRYLPLLYSKLFNFDINFSFYYSKYEYKYNDADIQNFKNNNNKILLTDNINKDFINNNLTKILFYDIDYQTLKIIQLDFKNQIEFIIYLLIDNNNYLLNNIISNK